MRHKILVIDDNYTTRSASYRCLEDACRDPDKITPPLFEIDLIYARTPLEIENLLSQNVFSAVILDIVLNNREWTGGAPVRASDMLSKLNNNIPVALLSSHWYSEEVKNLVAEWPTKNCRMFIHWDDLENKDRVKEGSLTRVLFELAKHIETYCNIDYSLQLTADDPIRILHLSDLQFGGFDKWKLKLDAGHCANTIRRLWPSGPTFIVITGDIAERGLPEEYEAAHKWVSELVAQFSWILPTSRLFIVPGNHDICLPFAAGSHLTLQETEESILARTKTPSAKKDFYVAFDVDPIKYNDLTDFAFRPYLDFTGRLAPRLLLSVSADEERRKASRQSLAWLEARFRHLGVVFFGLNTTQPVNPRKLPSRAIPLPTVEDITAEIRKVLDDGNPPLVIGMTHHYPLHGKAEWAVDEPEHFTQLFTDVPRIALWLHGHWHLRETTDHSISGGGRLVVNSAPTLSVREEHRPPDTARGFSMIELTRLNNRIDGCRITPVDWVGHSLRIREGESSSFTVDDKGYFRNTA